MKKRGKKIVFTNGCFDILHCGHVQYLEKAKSLGDYLVIGINSDKSVRKIKGAKRPITPQNERAGILAALASTNFIVIFNEPTPLKLIEALKPHLLIKGGDWKENNIVGADIVKCYRGKVKTIPFIKNYSTSKVIKFIIQKNAKRS